MDGKDQTGSPPPGRGTGNGAVERTEAAMTREQTLHSTIPFSLLATVMLVGAAALLGVVHLLDEPIYRFFCLGASAALLGATVMLLVLTKVLIWPAAIVLRR